MYDYVYTYIYICLYLISCILILCFQPIYYELVSSKSNPNDEFFAIVASNSTSHVEYHSIPLICGYFYVYFSQHIRTFIWHWLHGIDYKAEEIILFTNIFFSFLSILFTHMEAHKYILPCLWKYLSKIYLKKNQFGL